MASTELHLLGSFHIGTDDDPEVASSPGTQRLVVLLALRDRVVSRAAVAGALWPDASSDLAAVRLRAALTRLDPAARALVDMTPGGLRLSTDCAVDYRDALAYAEGLLEAEHPPAHETAAETRASIAVLCLELLPDSYDDWVLSEAEDWRLLRAAALEALTASLSADDRPHLAMGAARAAIRNEPLRETAQAALIRLHLVAGNQTEALRVYERYAEALHETLQLSPSPLLRSLVGALAPQS
jgi:DNA-binding SARP family transcriptional activator